MRALRPRAHPSSGFGADQFCRVSGGGLGRRQSSSGALAVASGAPPPPKRGKQPYFEGWTVRVVDATIGVAMVSVGSFRAPGSAAFSSHLLVVQHQHPIDPNGTERAGRVSQLLLDGDAVQIESRADTYPLFAPRARTPPDFAWRIVSGPSLGSFLRVNGSHAQLRFATAALRVELEASGRTPWRPEELTAGPEGGMSLVGALLPRRYFVHSLGSTATLTVTRPAPRLLAPRAAEVLRSADGLAHLEGTDGRLFPERWFWLNGLSWPGGPSVHAVGGRFRGGRFQPDFSNPQTFLLAYRHAARGVDLDFRTTDGDPIYWRLDACNGTLELEALLAHVRVHVSAEAPPSSFGPPIYAPTASGFSNAPGCSDSHGASVHVRAYARDSELVANPALAIDPKVLPQVIMKWKEWELVDSHTFEQSTLEFGGAYRCGAAIR